jgi:cytochrome P450
MAQRLHFASRACVFVRVSGEEIPAKMTNLEARDIFSHEHKRDPFPYYAQLRAQEKAIQITRGATRKAWLITRYSDVVASLDDGSVFVRQPEKAGMQNLRKMPWWLPSTFGIIMRSMVNLDDPEHLRLRNFVNSAFQRQRIVEMRPRIAAIACSLLDSLAAEKQPDIVAGFALPYPFMVTCELLGLPPKDWRRLHKWVKVFSGHLPKRKIPQAIPSVAGFSRYLRNCIKSRRSHPQPDLITELLRSDSSGDRLSDDETLAMVILLMLAGYQTTTNLIGSGMLTLFEHPDDLKALRQDPPLMRSAVDELLRFTAPLEMASDRYVAQDIVLHGAALTRGDVVLPVIASANRDERYFTDPDRLDIRRSASANVSFGHGIHHCLGFHLAKLEAEIAFSLILEKFPKITLGCKPEELRWRAVPVFRGVAALPVVLS